MNLDSNRTHSRFGALILLLCSVLAMMIACTGCNEDSTVSDRNEDPFAEYRDYFPLIEGSYWRYRNSESIDYRYVVVNTHQGSWADSADVLISGDGDDQAWLIYWDFDELIVTPADGSNSVKSYFIVPPDSGRTWRTQSSEGARSVYYSDATIVAVDSTITVMAGTWSETIVIREIQVTKLDGVVTEQDTTWTAYAKGVGQLFHKMGSFETILVEYSVPDTTGY